MTFSSYQHSSPSDVQLTKTDSPRLYESERTFDPQSRRRSSILLIGCFAILGYLAMTAGYDRPVDPNMRGSIVRIDENIAFPMDELWGSSQNSTHHHHKASSNHQEKNDEEPPLPPDAPVPDYNGEGRYNWQKCKNSQDPDCWKNEGQRVHSYWRDFGQKMKTAWQNFHDKMRSFFGGKKDDGEIKEETTIESKKKSSKH